MNHTTRATGRTLLVALRAMVVATVVLGLGYTAVILGVGQLVLPAAANGSLVRDTDGAVVGSSLIGQAFTDADGEPLPEYFQSRPSAAGDGYDGGAASGSNLGPNNDDLVVLITERRAQIADFNGVNPADVPADALTASGSGLDPHVSPEYALLQVERIALARSLPVASVRGLVEAHIQGPDLGFFGASTVNVLELNLALDALNAQ